MELKDYMAPELEVIKIIAQKPLLDISGSDNGGDDPMNGGGDNDPNVPFG